MQQTSSQVLKDLSLNIGCQNKWCGLLMSAAYTQVFTVLQNLMIETPELGKK